MTLYFLVKFLHILGAIVILGTGTGIAFFMLMAHRTHDVAFIARTASVVVIADAIFTLSAVILQPVSGGLLMLLSATSITERWLLASLALYAIAGLFWLHRRLALLWQAEQLRLADNNKKAILLYRRCARLNRISHAGNAAEVEAIGKKAAFSQHQITDEEVTVMEKGFFLAAARVRRSGRFKRFCYQYIVPLF